MKNKKEQVKQVNVCAIFWVKQTWKVVEASAGSYLGVDVQEMGYAVKLSEKKKMGPGARSLRMVNVNRCYDYYMFFLEEALEKLAG